MGALGVPCGSVIICLPVQETQETGVRSLGQEDPLEKEMATHSSIHPPGEFHGQRSMVGSLQSQTRLSD